MHRSGLSFSDVQSSVYWSSTTHANSTSYACGVDVNDGGVGHNAKTSTNFVWPARGGHSEVPGRKRASAWLHEDMMAFLATALVVV